ncbi:hypothetical protein QLX08_008994 [Tetragonisca angustula]|uniref:Uncharacterized protein n=1 Tax=Tetragonisca angustula TaxID=166442 RepID=A0AAW0ZHZ2_9HYME
MATIIIMDLYSYLQKFSVI